MIRKYQPQSYQSVSLDLKTKGDKFLYYKRRFELVEKTMKVFPFWNNTFVWLFLALSAAFLYFTLHTLDIAYGQLQQNINLLLFASTGQLVDKRGVYLLFFIPFLDCLLTIALGYKLYNTKRYIAYTVLLVNVIFTFLFFVAAFKFVQMNYAIMN